MIYSPVLPAECNFSPNHLFVVNNHALQYLKGDIFWKIIIIKIIICFEQGVPLVHLLTHRNKQPWKCFVSILQKDFDAAVRLDNTLTEDCQTFC